MSSRGPRTKPYKNRQERIKTPCANCGSIIEHIHSDVRKYCSNQCQQDHALDEAVAAGKYTRYNAIRWHRKIENIVVPNVEFVIGTTNR